ncbi:hypothetical protein AAC387_Pa10g0595 [Persea americana]
MGKHSIGLVLLEFQFNEEKRSIELTLCVVTAGSPDKSEKKKEKRPLHFLQYRGFQFNEGLTHTYLRLQNASIRICSLMDGLNFQ